jgi:HSP20 family protein
MDSYISKDTGYSVYPGGYVPLHKAKEIQEELKQWHKTKNDYLPVNIKELIDSFIVEVAMPGVKREDFLIEADENIVSICMLHNEYDILEGENFQLHKLNCKCFEREIILPKNVDTEFISAEYKAGILRLHVPKVKQPSKNLHTRIVIY